MPKQLYNIKCMALIELKHTDKTFGSGTSQVEVLKDINLEVKEGEFLAILGFTGSGKTTLISLMAGLEQATSGEVLMNGNPIIEPGPDRGVVFQNYSLLPWLTVFGNVSVAVKEVFPNMSRSERKAYVNKYIDMVGLTPAQGKYPMELSGGMRQRVSVARTLAMNPKVLLMDEPFSALDALTRSTLQDELAKIWEGDKKTVVLITNDVDESIILADRVIPLTPGPNATLGPSFKVDLPRPRDKKKLNSMPEFIKLRNSITGFLTDAGREANRNKTKEAYILPDIQPRDFQKDMLHNLRYGSRK